MTESQFAAASCAIEFLASFARETKDSLSLDVCRVYIRQVLDESESLEIAACALKAAIIAKKPPRLVKEDRNWKRLIEKFPDNEDILDEKRLICNLIALWTKEVLEHYGWHEKKKRFLQPLYECAKEWPHFENQFIPIANCVLISRHEACIIEKGHKKLKTIGFHHQTEVSGFARPLLIADVELLAKWSKRVEITGYGGERFPERPTRAMLMHVEKWTEDMDGSIVVDGMSLKDRGRFHQAYKVVFDKYGLVVHCDRGHELRYSAGKRQREEHIGADEDSVADREIDQTPDSDSVIPFLSKSNPRIESNGKNSKRIKLMRRTIESSSLREVPQGDFATEQDEETVGEVEEGEIESRSEEDASEEPIAENILALSEALMASTLIQSKKEPKGIPLVWADTRQALCETLPYFQTQQGGSHFKDGHIYSLLLDGIGQREYMDSDIVLTRARGCMKHDTDGHMRQVKDHSMDDAQVQAVLNDIKYQNPCVIICGNRHTTSPAKMPHRYCVLGWYKPISVWAEKISSRGTRTFTIIRYRFERLRTQKAWYAPRGSPTIDTSASGKLRSARCYYCGKEYPQVYLFGWTCLNDVCTAFWKSGNADRPTDSSLLYNPAYLLDRTSWANEDEPYSVKLPPPDVGKVFGDNLTYINTRGVCCEWCGRCNPRRLFRGWKCDTPGCRWTLFPQYKPIMPAVLHTPFGNVGYGPALVGSQHQAAVNLKLDYKEGYKVITYTFDHIHGRLIHAIANKTLNEESNGPNDMLIALQQADLGLERRRFHHNKRSGNKLKHNLGEGIEPIVEEGDLMTAFSMNYGMPYKFIANGATQSFENAPWPVLASRSKLNWAVRCFLDDFIDTGVSLFNEQLVLGYMECQKMEYHDDGEEGLGPCIGTLSLGGSAKMHMRIKSEHYVGCTKAGLMCAHRPIPNCLGGDDMFKRRKIAWEELQKLKNSAAYQERRRVLPIELGIHSSCDKKADDAVVITLGHGDIVLMEGHEIQKYLEHKVVSVGRLRFAMTCRTVLPHHLTD